MTMMMTSLQCAEISWHMLETMTTMRPTIIMMAITMKNIAGLGIGWISLKASKTESLEKAIAGGVNRRFCRPLILQKSSITFIW